MPSKHLNDFFVKTAQPVSLSSMTNAFGAENRDSAVDAKTTF